MIQISRAQRYELQRAAVLRSGETPADGGDGTTDLPAALPITLVPGGEGD